MKIIAENHNNQITVKDLFNIIRMVKIRYPNEWENIPVYLGEDDELNGVHTGWYVDLVNHDEDSNYIREMINECHSNHKLGEDEVAILIS